MSLITQASLEIQAYGDSTQENCAFKQSFSDKVIDTLTVESSGRIELPASSSDVQFDFQSVTDGKLIVLKSDSAFTVKLNGIGYQAINVAPQTHSTTNVTMPGFFALLGSGITSLYFANAATSAIYVDVVVAGT